MVGPFHVRRSLFALAAMCGWIGLLTGNAAARSAPTRPTAPAKAPATRSGAVLLGIDVLEAEGFAAVRGKRIGLLTHPAGVNRRGVSTIDVLRQAPGVRLTALFAPEHSLYGDMRASENVDDTVDRRSGLPVYSLHGENRKPTPAQLRGLDALVIDLQDIGVRSYTFAATMRYAMEACFAAGIEVIILDRPNPLGGLKVDGPLLDREWMSGVGAFQVPYVHGLTLGELARMAAATPDALAIPEAQRTRGRLRVVPMRGWRRSMRWPETGLRFVPTSPLVQDFAAVVGYAMIGLGCEYSGFVHGIGKAHLFRTLTFRGKDDDQLMKDLIALKVPGIRFRKTSAPIGGGKAATRVYVEVTNWEAWNPSELSFHLMRLACVYAPPNPFARLGARESRSFNIHVGSTAWWNALRRDGAKVNLPSFLAAWRESSRAFQQRSRTYWLYQ